MKIINLVLIVLLFASCAGLSPVTTSVKKDPITDKTILSTSQVSLQNTMNEPIGMPAFLFSGLKSDSIRLLVFEIRRVGNTNISGHIRENGLLQIKTVSDKLYELNSIKGVMPSYNVGSYGVTTWTIVAYYALPENIFNDLLNTQISFIRVHLDDGYLDRPITEKFAIRFKEVLTQIK